MRSRNERCLFRSMGRLPMTEKERSGFEVACNPQIRKQAKQRDSGNALAQSANKQEGKWRSGDETG
ncbi:MAG: hypothetical protein SOV67_14935 [Bariatricus massiliensis]|nr:hypothetical protein [Bariatricus massiliensis]